MMSDLHRFVREQFPGASPRWLNLCDGAITHAAPLAADFLSIRDLVHLSGYQKHESLHALLLLMFLALGEGSLCVEVSAAGLKRRLMDLVDDTQAQAWADTILTDLDQTGFPDLVGHSVQENKPVILLERSSPLLTPRYLYFHKLLRSELVFQEALQKRLGERNLSSQQWGPILREVLEGKPIFRGGQPVQLDQDQHLALGLALLKNFVVISGGPGTGKTSIVLTLVRCLLRGGLKPEQIALAAPTGRAAQRLADTFRQGLEGTSGGGEVDGQLSQLQARTLHQLLEYRPTRGTFRRHAENPIEAEVVIVDEVSMVGIVMMAQLFQALRPGTRLILLGDKDQLPSVEAGAVLAHLVPEGQPNRFRPAIWQALKPLFPDLVQAGTSAFWPDHVSVLQTNHRSQDRIRKTAGAINRQEIQLVESLPSVCFEAEEDETARWKELEDQGGCWFLEQKSSQPGDLLRYLQRWAGRHFLGSFTQKVRTFDLSSDWENDPGKLTRMRELFQNLEGSRVLTVIREGPWGCEGINRFLEQYLRPHLDRQGRGVLFAGAPVLITANDHARGLFNGDVGLTLRGRDGLRVVFPGREGFSSFLPDSLPAHELGFALTVHKSQGSEYDHVFLVLPPLVGKRLLTKEILYTGVTRAKKLVVLCTSRETLQFAIRRKINRESGMVREMFGSQE